MHEEGNHIPGHKHLSKPTSFYERVVLAVDDLDDAAEEYVDACCEKCGCEEEQERLHDVGTDCPNGGFLRGEGAADVADDLN